MKFSEVVTVNLIDDNLINIIDGESVEQNMSTHNGN